MSLSKVACSCLLRLNSVEQAESSDTGEVPDVGEPLLQLVAHGLDVRRRKVARAHHLLGPAHQAVHHGLARQDLAFQRLQR